MKRTMFVIRDKTTGLFCVSSRQGDFAEFNSAVFFNQQANAAKAMKKIRNTRKLNPVTNWYESFYAEMEVAEVTVTYGE